MVLNKEQCDVIMKEAFDGVTMPEYTVDDVNRILLECKPMVQEAVRLKIVLGKSSYEASRIMGYNSNYYARDLYNKFLNKVREAPSYSWFNHDKITLDENSSIEYLELSIKRKEEKDADSSTALQSCGGAHRRRSGRTDR